MVLPLLQLQRGRCVRQDRREHPQPDGLKFNACGTNCNGVGQSVWNNAGSARNTNDFYAATVFFKFKYMGNTDFVPTNFLSNLPNTKNEDASVLFGP
ncbi:hypothetical protein ACIQOW_08855 [Kitasatospora sp. NPDC091335]|uniref:hypothetical protein n=1 Tax=Kitasatospora sp. NPDC091335 TaxID=3364085 RepID=UPI0037F2F607